MDKERIEILATERLCSHLVECTQDERIILARAYIIAMLGFEAIRARFENHPHQILETETQEYKLLMGIHRDLDVAVEQMSEVLNVKRQTACRRTNGNHSA